MPVYTFRCIKCNHAFEIFASYSNYGAIKNKCPNCNSKKTERDYSIDLQNMTGTVIKSDGEIKLGDLANRNRDKMSEDHKAHLYKKHNEYKGKDIELPKGMSRIKKGKKNKWI